MTSSVHRTSNGGVSGSVYNLPTQSRSVREYQTFASTKTTMVPGAGMR